MTAWAAEDDVGATVAVVDDEELVLLEVVVALVVEVVAAVVEVELELDEELAPEVVLVLDEAELPVVGAIDVVVSGTVEVGAATVVSVVGAAVRGGSVTAADFGDIAWALALESLSASIPPRPAGLSLSWALLVPASAPSGDPRAWA